MDESASTDAGYLSLHSQISERRDYGLTSQIRRASASIGANIAEGCGRRSDPEMKRFIQISRGSASELEYHLLLARDLQLLTVEEFKDLEAKTLEIQRMLAALTQRLGPPILARS